MPFSITAKFKDSDELSEDAFVEKMMKTLHGYGGISLDGLLRSDVEMEAYNNATVFQKVKKKVFKKIHLIKMEFHDNGTVF